MCSTMFHTAEIRQLAINSDGKMLASCGIDRSIKLWDLEHKELITTMSGHTNFVNTVALSRDCKYVLSGSDDNSAR